MQHASVRSKRRQRTFFSYAEGKRSHDDRVRLARRLTNTVWE